MPATLTPTQTKTKIDDLCPDCTGTLLLTEIAKVHPSALDIK